MTIALLGTGLLGRAIAERLQSAGYTVAVNNQTATKALPLQACGITVVTRPEQAVAKPTVWSSCWPMRRRSVPSC